MGRKKINPNCAKCGAEKTDDNTRRDPRTNRFLCYCISCCNANNRETYQKRGRADRNIKPQVISEPDISSFDEIKRLADSLYNNGIRLNKKII